MVKKSVFSRPSCRLPAEFKVPAGKDVEWIVHL